MDIKIDLQGYDTEEIERYREIFGALLKSGGLSGVKGGQTIIHFDADGNFMGVQLSYWPYRRRTNGKS